MNVGSVLLTTFMVTAVVSLHVDGTESAPVSCDDGWSGHKSKCYKAVIANGTIRDEAQTACGNLRSGARLLCADGWEGYQGGMIAGMQLRQETGKMTGLWLGFHDRDIERGGNGERRNWQCDGNPAGNGDFVRLWDNSEPSGGTDENCVYVKGLRWEDEACTATSMGGYICEYEESGSSKTLPALAPLILSLFIAYIV